MKARNVLCVSHFTAGKGFRVLFAAREMFVRVPRTEFGAKCRGQQVLDDVVVPYLNAACGCDVVQMLDEVRLSIDAGPLNARCGVKPDFNAHPDTKLFPAHIESELFIRRSNADEMLKAQLCEFWKCVFVRATAVGTEFPVLPVPLVTSTSRPKKRARRNDDESAPGTDAVVSAALVKLPQPDVAPAPLLCDLHEDCEPYLMEDACARAYTSSEWSLMGIDWVRRMRPVLSGSGMLPAVSVIGGTDDGKAVSFTDEDEEHAARVALSMDFRGSQYYVATMLAHLRSFKAQLSNAELAEDAQRFVSKEIVESHSSTGADVAFSCPIISLKSPPRKWLRYDKENYLISRSELIESVISALQPKFEVLMVWTRDHVAVQLGDGMKAALKKVVDVANEAIPVQNSGGPCGSCARQTKATVMNAELVSSFPPCMRRVVRELPLAKHNGRLQLSAFLHQVGVAKDSVIAYAKSVGANVPELKQTLDSAYGSHYSAFSCRNMRDPSGKGPRGCAFSVDIEDLAPSVCNNSLDAYCQRYAKNRGTMPQWNAKEYFILAQEARVEASPDL